MTIFDVHNMQMPVKRNGESFPRGIRNNNPGNIKKSKIQWEGKVDPYVFDDTFEGFVTPLYGLRALAKLITTYYLKHRCYTINEIVSRYAPSNENNTSGYAAFIAANLGIGVNVITPLYFTTLVKLVRGIVAMENGQLWVDHYPMYVYDTALYMAGWLPDRVELPEHEEI